MADTVINNEGDRRPDGDGGSGWMVALVVIVLVILFFLFILPALSGNGGVETDPVGDDTTDIDVNLPDVDSTIDTSGDGLPEDGGSNSGSDSSN